VSFKKGLECEACSHVSKVKMPSVSLVFLLLTLGLMLLSEKQEYQHAITVSCYPVLFSIIPVLVEARGFH